VAPVNKPRPKSFVSILRSLQRLVRDDAGQDVVEYALLTAFLGLAALTAWSTIRDALGLSYAGTTTDVRGLWDTPAPSGSPPPSGS
jgi:Flp pilus assembly pilin Flp